MTRSASTRVVIAAKRAMTEWNRNYRHHGGAAALFRCLWGSVLLAAHGVHRSSEAGGDCLTFSVVPGLTALWAHFMRRAVDAAALGIVVGDCSGGFHLTAPGVQVLPLLNRQHGAKLDLFLHEVCKKDLVVISDDDVFWLDAAPWEWARQQLADDPRVAVVSLIPRGRLSSVLRGVVPQAMGSHCLVLRREVWLREQLSFRVAPALPGQAPGWFHDTGDLANRRLLERGYRVVIAPDEIRTHLVPFDGLSTWSVRIQERDGALDDAIAVDPGLRGPKALRAILTVRGLSALAGELLPSTRDRCIVRPELLDRAERACVERVGPAVAVSIQAEVDEQLLRLRRSAGLSR